MKSASWIAVLMLTSIPLFMNCSDQAIDGRSPGQSQNSSNSGGLPLTPRICFPGAGATGSPQTIDEAITLINTLPKPTSVACFLESLDRPLDIYSTNSTGSAQPSPDASNPRIFILRGNLFMSVVPKGVAKDLVEFSELDSTTTSIKGELHFPITTTLTERAPFDGIIDMSAGSYGTTCRFCHSNEVLGTKGYEYSSRAIKPSIFAKVPFADVQGFYLNCNKLTEPDRCEILRAIFGHGTVRHKEFPATMPGL